jgi:hypothetical protein
MGIPIRLVLAFGLLAVVGVTASPVAGAVPQARPGVIFPDTADAGYFTSGLSPTSVKGTFVVPTFTCTGVQEVIISVGLTWTGLGAEDEVLVNCAGSGKAPTLSAFACSTSACDTSLAVHQGDKVKAKVSATAAASNAQMTDVTTSQSVTSTGLGNGPALNATFTDSRLDPTTPSFTTLTFSGMTVDGAVLTGADSFTQKMDDSTSTIQVTAKPITAGSGTLVFKHT